MTLEEVEETLTRLQSKPGVLGTLLVTGSPFSFTPILDEELPDAFMSGVLRKSEPQRKLV